MYIGKCVENLDPMRTYLPSRQIYKYSDEKTRLRSMDASKGTFTFSAEYILLLYYN